MNLSAAAKVNLSLEVFPADPEGYHPLRSWAVSVGWEDELVADWADDGDEFVVEGTQPEGFPTDASNLVWRAVEMARAGERLDRPISMKLTKRIPVAAGLAGGSADAAAALVALDRLTGTELAWDRAPSLGSDVRFCLRGGSAILEGRGERVSLYPAPDGVVLGVVVPPFELATADVYRRWDRLGGPEGRPVPDRDLPPSLRENVPLRNDLYAAATSLEPDIDGWRAELAGRWDRPVLMSGSGSALFAFFSDLDEAEGAIAEAPTRNRGAKAAPLTSAGVSIVDH